MDNEKTGFLFDLDGVLIDSENEYTRIWQAIDRRFPTGIDNFAIMIKGQTLPEILGRNYPSDMHGEVTAMLNELEQAMRYEMLPGALEMLCELRRRGVPTALVTSSNNLKMKHLREEQPELESYFDVIVTADRITRSKPDPEGYLLGAKLLGARPEKCVVFEDSAQGVKAGRAAGAYVIGLSTTLPADQIKEHCDRVVQDLSEVDVKEVLSILEKR